MNDEQRLAQGLKVRCEVLEHFPFKSFHVLRRISCFVALSNAKPAATFAESALGEEYVDREGDKASGGRQ